MVRTIQILEPSLTDYIHLIYFFYRSCLSACTRTRLLFSGPSLTLRPSIYSATSICISLAANTCDPGRCSFCLHPKYRAPADRQNCLRDQLRHLTGQLNQPAMANYCYVFCWGVPVSEKLNLLRKRTARNHLSIFFYFFVKGRKINPSSLCP
jgi:hypothetical protein